MHIFLKITPLREYFQNINHQHLCIKKLILKLHSMLLPLTTTETLVTANNLVVNKTTRTKKKKNILQITHLKVRLFFWNLSPMHWYDNFGTIHIDMNEFVKPSTKKV